MEIVSVESAAFVALALLVYHALGTAVRPHALLLLSYVFCCAIAWWSLPVLWGLTLITYGVAQRLEPARPGERARRRRLWLWIGLAANLLALGSLRWLYRGDPFAGPFVVLGVSFYSLQAMSYLLDLRSGAMRRRVALHELALYLAYFPKLAAGPIERARTFLPRLAHPAGVDDAAVARAGTLIAVGLTRKLAIADPLRTLLPADAFANPGGQGAAVLAATITGYGFVLYNDFAGYTDIARGVSTLFGIELSRNFAAPFFARSFSDFWNRWHITLSHWLRDYVYLPLSRFLLRRNPTLRNVPNLVVPPLATMLAAGLWHGSGAHMLVWGGLHGVYLIGERAWGLWLPPAPHRVDAPWERRVAVAAVFVLGCWALVAFRNDMATTWAWWSAILRAQSGPMPNPRMLLYIAPSLWLDWMLERHGPETTFDHWPRAARVSLLAGAMALWLVMTRVVPPTPFIYRGF
jgi:D-alanyl-lipoteichoic acid acyltransferase DltB (MBOAT superfamily)